LLIANFHGAAEIEEGPMRHRTLEARSPARRSPFRFAVLAVSLLLATAATETSSLALPQEGLTTVYLVRHAEKDLVPENDPPLSIAGQERALELLHVLEEAGVDSLFASQYQRTQSTLRPLAESLGIDLEIVDARDPDDLARLILRDHRGEEVVVCGHSNTVPAIIEALGAGTVEPIVEANEYDNLYVVRVTEGGTAKVTTLKYGRPPQ
jgi:broad specificity phosphatase PhoE